jgi:hypothetical protein
VVGLAGTLLSTATATAPTTTTTVAQAASTTTTVAPTAVTTIPADRPIGPEAYAPLAAVGDLAIVHPTGRVERVGFHESSLNGAIEMTVLPTAVEPTTLNTRDRGHGSRTAVDVVSDPFDVVRAPVSGVVVTAGPYQLYCSHHDDTVVIVPDGHPTWRVRVLHIDGVRVVPGWRVEAGITPIAARPRRLPFRSQIDRLAAASPSWPHVHVEVDDDTIPDTPSSGDSC